MTNHLYDALIKHQVNPDARFLLIDEPGRPGELSYSVFAARAAQIAHVLVDHGVSPGDRVLVQAPKRTDMLALYLATVQCGGVFLPLNTGYTLDEVTYFINDATPVLVICESHKSEGIAPVAKTMGATMLTIDKDNTGTLQSLADSKPGTFTTVARGPDDLAAFLYTSGTTGRSKGAMLTHDNLLSNAETLVDLWRITSKDTLIHALPIFHTHGLFVAVNTCMLAGACINFMDGFNLDTVLEALPRSTLMMGVPTFYTRLLTDERLSPDAVSSMRLFISGSAPLLAETHDAFSQRTGHRILERYGMTETNMITSNPYEGARIAGTVGMTLSGVDIRLCKPDGTAVEDGDIGMIEVRGPNVFKGYWNMPEKTAEELRENGFFITGDLGQIGADGYLRIVGRQKDLIITGGYNVYPKEIEDLLNDVPGIDESAVYGVPHADFGEQIIAALVPMPGAELDVEKVRSGIEASLARFKHPQVYKIMEALPRNTMGKVQKNVLRANHVESAA